MSPPGRAVAVGRNIPCPAELGLWGGLTAGRGCDCPDVPRCAQVFLGAPFTPCAQNKGCNVPGRSPRAAGGEEL